MTIQLSRRGFLGTLAAVAMLGRAVVKAAESELNSGWVPLSSLRPDKWARQTSPWLVDYLVESIRERGILSPIILHKDGSIADGLHRYAAAKILDVHMVFVRVI